MSVPPKDPLAVKDYRFMWSDWLASGETIFTAEVVVGTGLTLDVSSVENSNTSVLAYFSGGTAGEKYKVTCKIVTDSDPARYEQRSIYIEVADQ